MTENSRIFERLNSLILRLMSSKTYQVHGIIHTWYRYHFQLAFNLTTGINRAAGGGLAVLASLCVSNDDAGSARVTKADDPTSTDETARWRNGPRSIGRGRSSPSLESELTEHALVRKRRCCREAILALAQEHESAIGAAVQEADGGGIAQLWIMTIPKQTCLRLPNCFNPPHSLGGFC